MEKFLFKYRENRTRKKKEKRRKNMNTVSASTLVNEERVGEVEEKGWKHLEGEVEQSFRAHGRLVCRGWTF